MGEQRQAMVQLADERRLLAEERAQVSISQRMHSERENTEQLKQSQGSAKYEGIFNPHCIIVLLGLFVFLLCCYSHSHTVCASCVS